MAVTFSDKIETGTPTSETISGPNMVEGHRILVMTCHRSEGDTPHIADDNGALTWAEIARRNTTPLDATSRRGVILWEAVITAAAAGISTIVTSGWRDALGSEIAVSMVTVVVEEGTGYDLHGTSGADSGTVETTSQGTGSTASVPAGDVLVVTSETTRGQTTRTWTTTTNTPGVHDLTVLSGTGANARAGSVGYAALLGQAAQTWADTVSYGTARMSSALIGDRKSVV